MSNSNIQASLLSGIRLMLFALLLYSFLPLLIELSGSWASVAFITGFWMVFQALTNLITTGIVSSKLLRLIPATTHSSNTNQEMLRTPTPSTAAKPMTVWTWLLNCMGELRLWVLLFSFLSAYRWVFFAWSARRIEIAVTTIVIEFWPIIFLIGRGIIHARSESRANDANRGKARASVTDVVLMAIAAGGLMMVIFSEHVTDGSSGSGTLSASITGIFLAVVALLLASTGVIAGITFGEHASQRLRGLIGDSDYSHFLAKYSTSNLAEALPRLVAGVLTITWGIAESSVNDGTLSWTAVGIGASLGVLHGVASSAFVAANHLSYSDTVNSLYYGMPVVSLAWLWIFAEVVVGDVTMFLAGSVGIVAVNMVMHLDPEGTGRLQGQSDSPISGQGFKALVIAIWGAGSVVLLRDQWFSDAMLSWSIPEYWAMLAICATVFVLILSFRQSRLTDRQRDADRLTLAASTDIEICYDRHLFDRDERDSLMQSLHDIDSKPQIKDIGSAYFTFRKQILKAVSRKDSLEGRERLRALLRDIEILANLRQQGRNVAELAVMTLFAILTVLLALLGRPEANGLPNAWAGFLSELVAMAFAAAISFLMFDLLDRRLERDSSLLRVVTQDAQEEAGQPAGWRLNLYSYTDPTTDRIISFLLGGFVLTVFTVLLYNKWF